MQTYDWKKVLKSKVIYWIYTTMIIPLSHMLPSCGGREAKLAICRNQQPKLQKMSCLCVMGACCSIPTVSIKVLLDLPPLHLWVEVEARIGLYRFKCNSIENITYQGYGHLNFSKDGLPNHILDMWFNKMIPRRVYDRKFTITISECSK